MYLLVQKDNVTELNVLSEAISHLDIKMNKQRRMVFQGIEDSMSYSLEWSLFDCVLDFIRTRLNKFYSQTGIKIYKAELL